MFGPSNLLSGVKYTTFPLDLGSATHSRVAHEREVLLIVPSILPEVESIYIVTKSLASISVDQNLYLSLYNEIMRISPSKQRDHLHCKYPLNVIKGHHCVGHNVWVNFSPLVAKGTIVLFDE